MCRLCGVFCSHLSDFRSMIKAISVRWSTIAVSPLFSLYCRLLFSLHPLPSGVEYVSHSRFRHFHLLDPLLRIVVFAIPIYLNQYCVEWFPSFPIIKSSICAEWIVSFSFTKSTIDINIS
ncbi:hypothetical protein ACP275_09G055400 [Erythranthe tilingii]